MPKVFISSTSEDLKDCRQAARNAVNRARGFEAVMMEYTSAQGALRPYESCMADVAECDLVVTIVAHRYGSIPPDQPGRLANRTKSITWLECEHAKKLKLEVLAFIIDDKAPWPAELRESYRLELGAPAEEVTRNLSKLREFKAWLNGLGFRGTFTNCENLETAVFGGLTKWKERHNGEKSQTKPPQRPKANPSQYLARLRDQTAWIDIRGLQVGSGRAHRFPIEELYIPLTTIGDDGRAMSQERKGIALEEALRHQHLVIVGDPGSGKTTFLRRVAFELCRKALHQTMEHPLALPSNGFPLLVRVSELEQHIETHRGRDGAPTAKDSPAWLVHFFKTASQEYQWELDGPFFEARLREKTTILLLDGLDEAPSRTRREDMARLFEQSIAAYNQCRFVVTTRPGSYTGKTTLAGFREVRVQDLEDDAIEAFLSHWSQSLFPEDQASATKHMEDLQRALQAVVGIRRLARNPAMLTALAVVQWNERRLPEQRADLYESILTWLARQRENRPGREPAERCVELLGQLALGMQNEKRGRLTQVDKGRAAEIVAPLFRDTPGGGRFSRAQQFLDEEEVDSGIAVSRGPMLEFWHLTFQEHLAARAIAGFGDADQFKLLFEGDKLYRPEWREVVLLLAGVLHVKQGRAKVDGLFSEVMERLGDNPYLKDRARCAGLLGAIVGDLRPLKYQPADPRYKRVLDSVLAIFDPEQSEKIELRVRLEAAEALGQAGDPRLKEDNWVTIPAGTFRMGAQKTDPRQPNYDSNASDDEGPLREMQLGAFQIGRYPVTVEEYDRFVRDDGYQDRGYWKNGGFGERTQPDDWEEQLLHPNRPVVSVSWCEAAAYCAWATGRLPSESEWERAARGPEGRKYPWGDEPPDPSRANYDETKSGAPTPVGLFPRGATPEGIQDLAGNVWEWTADWYKPKPNTGRVVRGGSWDFDSRLLRAAYRDGVGPELRVDLFGFRCVREVP